jgi:hypothetical protein
MPGAGSSHSPAPSPPSAHANGLSQAKNERRWYEMDTILGGDWLF